MAPRGRRERTTVEGAGQPYWEVRMGSAKSVGRVIGVLLLVHLAAALTVPFVLLERVRRPAGFLASAAGSSVQVRAAVLLLFVGSAVAVGIAIAALPVFRRYSSALALWLLALAVAGFSLRAVDNGALLSMPSLSHEYANAGAAKAELFQAVYFAPIFIFEVTLGFWLLVNGIQAPIVE